MRRNLLALLFDWAAGIASDGSNPGGSEFNSFAARLLKQGL